MRTAKMKSRKSWRLVLESELLPSPLFLCSRENSSEILTVVVVVAGAGRVASGASVVACTSAGMGDFESLAIVVWRAGALDVLLHG